jgi:hypothetical protein
MNRMWQKYFGRGIVETENDLGTQGDRPTHPELLDYLALEFVEANESKAMQVDCHVGHVSPASNYRKDFGGGPGQPALRGRTGFGWKRKLFATRRWSPADC